MQLKMKYESTVKCQKVICFASQPHTIGLRNSFQVLIQSKIKPNLSVTRSHKGVCPLFEACLDWFTVLPVSFVIG